ncbi:type 1 glutamine amidotransferase [Rubrobacter taiwanensis]|jgi:GMP synthase-like glutamine amidotransferase|uniref:Type 1 glutamine amidotransferase n=1 Tax=Rubrobacter taiwanensis TaxID=185139 RepID=A0A4R1BFI1_9ACTN|nr:type 1 glutamine amidotransferase [Rubrobacter taiwanensis]TCJ15877.1 type 1 glutamine amidotransferase [Rubrobacter taiwanensis]
MKEEIKPALIRQHGPSSPPALLADWLRERGMEYEVSRSWLGERVPDPRRYSFVASLGSRFSPRDAHEPAVAAELELIEHAVEQGVPVLGLCFGGQVLSAVLGGRTEPLPHPELGWHEIETRDPESVPPGPWLEWHFEGFTVPAGATLLARTERSAQAFRYGPHLGIQFHPESTVEVVAQWARKDRESGRLGRFGIEDGSGLLAAPPGQREAARKAAFRLFDAFLEHIREGGAGEPADETGGKERR